MPDSMRPLRTRSPHDPGNGPAPDGSPCIDELLDGVARLIEGQRRFAEEFGVPYSRVFMDGFEAFKGRAIGDVLRDWLDAEHGADKLRDLLEDLANHQLALLESAGELARSPSALPRPRLSLRNPFSLFAPRPSQEALAPMAAAYARSREASRWPTGLTGLEDSPC